MIKVQIKPLSANEAWRGIKRKTPAYMRYERDLSLLLPSLVVPSGKLEVFYRFGLSSKNSDYDNCVKQFQDVISKKYDFNDNRIYRAVIEKVDVKKGEEFIVFDIKKLND